MKITISNLDTMVPSGEKGSVPSLGRGVSKFTNNFTSLMFLNVVSEAFLNANVKMMVTL